MDVVERKRCRERQGREALAEALERIARGRTDNGRPLSAETARQIARDALLRVERDWKR